MPSLEVDLINAGIPVTEGADGLPVPPLRSGRLTFWAALPGDPPAWLYLDGTVVVAAMATRMPPDLVVDSPAAVLALGPRAAKVWGGAAIAFPGSMLRTRDAHAYLVAPVATVTTAGRAQALALLLRNLDAGFGPAPPLAPNDDEIPNVTYSKEGWIYGIPDPGGKLVVTPAEAVFSATTRTKGAQGASAALARNFGLVGAALAGTAFREETGKHFRWSWPKSFIESVSASGTTLVLHSVFDANVQLNLSGPERALPLFERHGYKLGSPSS